ncbi:hypothetical protein [Streptococcus himalayensis]|uniref:Uncharacterized protein n=1 Tax=Streptococcus himalayensis TaxID=1888195 RepID=A0A917A9J9_9STRE|nr:hypothetical protein [Streptococcus himalayensis]GGE36753.1 hypothetical protein GCM10011510_17660 [Streptococcus himalayensis]
MDPHNYSFVPSLKTLLVLLISQIILGSLIVDGYLHGKSYVLFPLYIPFIALYTGKTAILKNNPEKLPLYNLHQIVIEFTLFTILTICIAAGTFKLPLLIFPILLAIHIVSLGYTIWNISKK